jgi:hypothetical protein
MQTHKETAMKPASLARYAVVALVVSPLAAFAQAFETPGKIENVTVYRGQALVSRLVAVPAAKGVADAAGTVREVVITDLPARVRPESVHAESRDGIKVRSVRFRTRPVVQDTREEVRKLDEKIEAANDLRGYNQRKIELINEHRNVLTGLQNFVAPAATLELTRGVLNAETLERLTTFVRAQRGKMWDEEAALGSEVRRLAREVEQLQRERQVLTAGLSRTVNEAVVLVATDAGATGELTLRYLVDGATWSPSYSLRATKAGEGERTLGLEYYANIQQMSGEDWSGVSMTLSTATPSLVAKAPTLTSMVIGLGSVQNAQAPAQPMAYADARRELVDKQRQVEETRAQGRAGKGGPADRDDALDQSLNSFAKSIAVLDLTSGEKFEKSTMITRRSREEGLSVTYTIAGRTTMPSRSDQQLIQIAALPLKAEFVKVATPVLTNFVYDEASAVNTSTMVLLAGPVTAYLDGAFVGSGELPTVSVGERFTTGLGIDSSLRAGRELIDRTESIQGGNRVVELTYRLTLENFGSEPAPVRLLDLLPKVQAGQQASDIRVTMVSMSEKLSDADEYVKTQKKDGLLRWDVVVPPQTVGSNAAGVEYKFRLEYDKQMALIGMQ